MIKMIVNLVGTDLKQIFRDKTLTVFLMAPLLLIAFVRYFVPYITVKYPFLAEYHSYVMMFGGIQTAILFGFISAFILLDEKDENVLQVIRILPVSTSTFILYRLSFATVFSTIGAFALINLGGISYPGFGNSLLLSILCGLTAPLITLVIATFAKNKIEGMAFFKGLDLLLLLPILSFFLNEIWRNVFALIPTYWTYNLYSQSISSGNVVLYFSVGILVYLLFIWTMFVQFKKRVFNR